MTIEKNLQRDLIALDNELKEILSNIFNLIKDDYNSDNRTKLVAMILCDLIDSFDYPDGLIKEIIFINALRKIKSKTTIDYVNSSLDKIKYAVDEQKDILTNLGNNSISLESIKND